MTMISVISNGRCDAVVDGLRAEFGVMLADRILEVEAMDFLWDARVKERYLGQHFSLEDDAGELSRVAILSVLAGRWHAALCLVDGEGRAVDLFWKQDFDGPDEAEAAFGRTV